MKRTFWKILCIVLSGCIFILLASFNPENHAFFPKCPFFILTNLQCPGCGSQRAIYNLIHGNIANAFSYNALLVISIPFVVLLVVAEILKKRYSCFYENLHSSKVILSCLIIVISWWILRNTFSL